MKSFKTKYPWVWKLLSYGVTDEETEVTIIWGASKEIRYCSASLWKDSRNSFRSGSTGLNL